MNVLVSTENVTARIQAALKGGSRQLFYIHPDKKLLAVSFDPRNGIAGAPEMLFQTLTVAASVAGIQYDVSSGGRFLINSLPSHTAPLTLLTGWTGTMK